jgi:hypothetical protein
VLKKRSQTVISILKRFAECGLGGKGHWNKLNTPKSVYGQNERREGKEGLGS